MGPTPQAVKHLFMFITHPTWKVEGAPGALLTPAIPWHSALLDVSEPCFIVAPNVNAQIPLTHIRLFSDIDELLAHVHCEIDDEFIVYALSRFDDALSISVVTAIGSYPCPQTGIKLRAYLMMASSQGLRIVGSRNSTSNVLSISKRVFLDSEHVRI